jgi:putative transposase
MLGRHRNGGMACAASTRLHVMQSRLCTLRSRRVIEVLARLMSVHGAPAHLRSDSGPEFVSRAILQWLTDARIETAIIDPGKPWQNGTNESLNGKFRDECLSVEWFRTRREA